ncbi:MAG: DUF433 domain-containing protein [Desulfococcaceae bacterium]
MTEKNDIQTAVVRTDRGLSIAGTRITLYQIMDYIRAGRSPSVIRDHFRLTVKQTSDILKYIEVNKDKVETEYKQVVAYDEEIRHYWEERNREHFAKLKTVRPEPCREHLYAKLRSAKARLGMV